MEDSGPDDTDVKDSGPDDTDTEDSGPDVIVESSKSEAEDSDIDVGMKESERHSPASYFLTPLQAMEGLWS